MVEYMGSYWEYPWARITVRRSALIRDESDMPFGRFMNYHLSAIDESYDPEVLCTSGRYIYHLPSSIPMTSCLNATLAESHDKKGGFNSLLLREPLCLLIITRPVRGGERVRTGGTYGPTISAPAGCCPGNGVCCEASLRPIPGLRSEQCPIKRNHLPHCVFFHRSCSTGDLTTVAGLYAGGRC